MNERVEALEAIVMGSVAITARALAEAAPDLTLLQWRIVVLIGRQRGGTSLRDISRTTGVTSSALSRLVGRLVAKGMVATSTGSEDRRLTLARLTTEGEALLERVVHTRARVLEEIAASPAIWAGDPLAALADEFRRYS